MKAHSERVPGKNIKKLADKPLFFHIADKLKKTARFKLLAINTDSEEIASLSKERYGSWVKIIDRPAALCGDDVPMNSIIAHDVNLLGIDNDYFQTHSTNPFLSVATIIDALNQYLKEKINNTYDSFFSVNAIYSRLYSKDLKPLNHKEHILLRTQDLEVIYEENSSFYIFSGQKFFLNNHRIGKNPNPYVMDRNSFETIDIDNYSDWYFSEMIIKNSEINE